MTEKQPYGTVLIKADRILHYLAQQQTAQTLISIAKGSDLTASTTSKILDTLCSLNYVQKSEVTKAYKIGGAFVSFAQGYLEGLDIITLSQPYLAKLQSHFDETIHLGVLENDSVVYVNKLESTKPITLMSSKVGNKVPLYCTGMGKALLSELSEEAFAGYLSRVTLKALTPNTITDKNKLTKVVQTIKKQGYAFDDEEREDEVFCVAASIMNGNSIVGAFSISLPKYRVSDTLTPLLIEDVKATKAEIENAISSQVMSR